MFEKRLSVTVVNHAQIVHQAVMPFMQTLVNTSQEAHSAVVLELLAWLPNACETMLAPAWRAVRCPCRLLQQGCRMNAMLSSP